MRVDSTVGRNPTAPGMYKPLVSGIFEPSTIALLEQKQQTRCQVEQIHRDLVRQRDTFGRSRNFFSRWIQVGTLEKTFSKLDSNKSIEIIVIWRMLYFKESLRCDPWKHDDVNKNRIQNKGIHFPGSPIRRWHEWKVKFAKKGWCWKHLKNEMFDLIGLDDLSLAKEISPNHGVSPASFVQFQLYPFYIETNTYMIFCCSF